MSSNVQTQINDLNAAVQALDSSLTQITGNTMSNYNQLSRIVAQQAGIYNSVYYGTGNISTENLVVGSNCNISGNLILSNGNLGIGITNPQTKLHMNGSMILKNSLSLGIEGSWDLFGTVRYYNLGSFDQNNGGTSYLSITYGTLNNMNVNSKRVEVTFFSRGLSTITSRAQIYGQTTDFSQFNLQAYSLTSNPSSYEVWLMLGDWPHITIRSEGNFPLNTNWRSTETSSIPAGRTLVRNLLTENSTSFDYNGNVLTSGNLVISRGANISGNLDVVGLASFKSGTTGILQTILSYQALPSAAIIENTTPFPDDVSRIVININGASTTSTTAMFVRVGTVSGTYQTSGYNGGSFTTADGTILRTDRISISNGITAAAIYYTILELIKVGSNDIWMYKYNTIIDTSAVGSFSSGSGVVTLTTGKLKYLSFNSGAGNFDAGSISILSC